MVFVSLIQLVKRFFFFPENMVENGKIESPIKVMRFDESIYQMLGDKLAGLSKERDFLFDSSSYGQRSFASYFLPGALIDAFTLTL